MNIVETIVKRRKLLGISQQALADISGIGLRTIKQMESDGGNPSLKTLNRILYVLGMELVVQIKNGDKL